MRKTYDRKAMKPVMPPTDAEDIEWRDVVGFEGRNDLGLPDQFPWPQPQALTRTIADVLDEDVAENFFLKPESVISFLTRNEQGDRCLYRVSDHLPTPDEVRQWVRETEPSR